MKRLGCFSLVGSILRRTRTGRIDKSAEKIPSRTSCVTLWIPISPSPWTGHRRLECEPKSFGRIYSLRRRLRRRNGTDRHRRSARAASRGSGLLTRRHEHPFWNDARAGRVPQHTGGSVVGWARGGSLFNVRFYVRNSVLCYDRHGSRAATTQGLQWMLSPPWLGELPPRHDGVIVCSACRSHKAAVLLMPATNANLGPYEIGRRTQSCG
jgi:hypothetical protein